MFVTRPAVGLLTNAGAAVTAGQSVLATDIAAGKLVFAPAAGGSGCAYASFQFEVRDDGGTANGGLDTSAPAVVTSTWRASTARRRTANVTCHHRRHVAYVFTIADFPFSDPNDHAARHVADVIVTSLPAPGSLTPGQPSPSAAGQAVLAATTSRPASWCYTPGQNGVRCDLCYASVLRSGQRRHR